MVTEAAKDSAAGAAEARIGVAVIGMAGRFPGARDVRELWQRLCAGEECLTRYEDDELRAAGVSDDLLRRPDYVKTKGEVADADCFDAPFFGIPPREAELLDPQHRLLLECAWEALEDAGYDPAVLPAAVGVFAGKALDTYLLLNVLPAFDGVFTAASLQAAIGNDKDSLTSTVAYHLDLRGPAITVQTSSSTSLVAVCTACQSLLTYQCDLALAGGVAVGSPLTCGYLAEEGGITSRDGHCRAFDAASSGFVPGTGVGLVVLKRLDQALADGDRVYAVIRGFAVNNDGRGKVSYTAPSIDGHAQVIREARELAGLRPHEVTYVEAHGTGTRLGDPVEVAALRQAFADGAVEPGSCAIGSLKTNIGHLDTAAGVAGLIKAVWAVDRGLLPPSLHFERPNPACELEGSPFYVNTQLRSWRPACGVRRAGVSSLGMGGTNAHVVVEEAPPPPARPPAVQRPHLFVCSARSRPALERNLERLTRSFEADVETEPRDAAYTLCRGRSAFRHRAAVVAETLAEAAERFTLAAAAGGDEDVPGTARPLCFLFPGQGSQAPGMGAELYRREPAYRAAFDACAELAAEHLQADLRDLLYGPQAADEARLAETRLCQPALFAVEYALASLWQSWGLEPQVMVGHSLGEWVAATRGGLFELADAVRLVVARAEAMGAARRGSMVSLVVDPAAAEEYVDDEVWLAAVNAPSLCVLSGPQERIGRLVGELRQEGLQPRLLATSHAYHSASMRPAAETLRRHFAEISFGTLRGRLISTALGRELTAAEAADPDYWCRQILLPVRFAEAVTVASPSCAFLEVGPGSTLLGLTRRTLGAEVRGWPSLPGRRQKVAADRLILDSLGALWTSGQPVRWQALYPSEEHRRTPLPTYSFDRIRYWLPSPAESGVAPRREEAAYAPRAVPRRQPRPPLSTAYVGAETEAQRRLVAIFEELLGISGVGIDDDLFELGGQSLMVTMLVSRVRETFGAELELDRVFEAANVRALATALDTTPAGETLLDRLLDETLGAVSG